MKKCDVIIPVYKSPEWVKLCVYALFKNTAESVLNKVYLINDCDDPYTTNCLKNLKEKYDNKIELLQNKQNLGFIKTTNRGLKESKADYALLLNTDCLVSKDAIEKMINNIKDDPSIGLICPISSNAANLTFDMFEGFNYSMMNNLFESKFKGMMFDACTVVGNCLLITRDCLDKAGYLDEAYGMGYGEETDYQFKAMSKGFKAKVCIDTYVFHKSEVSFGTSKEKQERLNKNRELFFSRWGEEYNDLLKKYEKNDPIKYINDHLTNEDKKPVLDTAIYLNGIVQNAGGVHVVVDMVNYLAINNQNVNIVYDIMSTYKEIMLFNPIESNALDNVKIAKIMSTVWSSVFSAKKITDSNKCKLLSFVQGNEVYFENGSNYGKVETSYKLPDSILTISNYLKKNLKDTYNVDSTLITNGINVDLLKKDNNNTKVKSITIVMRNNAMKGDWLLLEIIRKLDKKCKNLNFNVLYMDEHIEFPRIVNNQLVKYLGPLSRADVNKLLQSSDIYIDASLNEGFGLNPIEAMAAGNVCVVSNSFGNSEYMVDGINGFVINDVNNSDEYVNAVMQIINDSKLFSKMLKETKKTLKDFDYDDRVDDYIKFFNEANKSKNNNALDEYDKEIINSMLQTNEVTIQKKRKIYYLARLMPKFIKKPIKKIVVLLYGCFNHN
ncbi:MAG: glycosyltransferase [Bacilli bacterium]|nr:glycosyltransferase [Bacilli bacterium]